MPAPYTNVFIDVQAANETVGFAFAQMLIKQLAAIRGRECLTAMLGTQPMGGEDVVFCRSPDWADDNPVFRLDILRHHMPINTLILTPAPIWSRHTGPHAIEDYTADAGIDVITLLTYGDERDRTRMAGHFGAIDTRHVVRLRMVLALMMDERCGGRLMGLPGHTPGFILHPDVLATDGLKHLVGVLATFPPWTRRQAAEVLGDITPAFLYSTYEKTSPPAGPIPLSVTVEAFDGWRHRA